MADDDERLEAAILVDSYDPDSPLVALATFASPACRIEPQLLRRLRLECVPTADVSVEQELWQSELVDGRGKTITFREAVARVLRERLRALHDTRPDVVRTARTVMAAVHAELSPLLILEDELAWAEVVGDAGAIGDGARTLLHSLLARRDGLDYWLGRAWGVLPASLKTLPQGRELAQVAAAKGARIDDDPTVQPPVQQVAHVLPIAPLPLRLEGLVLGVNVRPSEATHVIDVPQTRPLALSVTTAKGTEELVFGPTEARSTYVPPGLMQLRTVSGAEYEIMVVQNLSATFAVELLPAGHSTSLLIRYGSGTTVNRILVDCGTRRVGTQLAERLRGPDGDAESVELFVLTHIDDGHIGGAIPLLSDQRVTQRLFDIWFNASGQLGVQA